MSLFITFEGGEGVGKTTQIELLAEDLNTKGFQVVKTREPGGTHLGLKIRELLLTRFGKDINHQAELFLYAADRAQHIHEVIRPALAANKILLCDRYADATSAYQGYGRGMDLHLIQELNHWATGGLEPDLTFLLDAPPKLGITRSKKRLEEQESQEDRFEREALAFHEKVRNGYLELAKTHSMRFITLDAVQGISTLHKQILQTVLKRLSS